MYLYVSCMEILFLWQMSDTFGLLLKNQYDKVVKRRSECRLYNLTGGQTGRQADRRADRRAGRQRHVLRGCAAPLKKAKESSIQKPGVCKPLYI